MYRHGSRAGKWDFDAKARVHGREDQRRPITYLVNLQSLSAKIPRTSTLLIIFGYIKY